MGSLSFCCRSHNYRISFRPAWPAFHCCSSLIDFPFCLIFIWTFRFYSLVVLCWNRRKRRFTGLGFEWGGSIEEERNECNKSGAMASLSLKISIVEKDVVKTMQFDPNTAVYDACRVIRDKITEANLGQRKSSIYKSCFFFVSLVCFDWFHLHRLISFASTAKDYGLFLADEDPKKGIWLEPGRNLGYYVLRTGVSWVVLILFILIDIPMATWSDNKLGKKNK